VCQSLAFTMPKWWSNFWDKHDPDDLFSYNTVKMVRIRDRQLGIMHYVFLLGIIGYIVGYVMIYSQAYLKFNQPVGLVRANIQRCPGSTFPGCQVDTSTLSYCNGQANPTLDCLLLDEQDVVLPPGQSGDLLVGTRVNQTVETRVCKETDTSCNGVMWAANASLSSSFYVAGVEDWSVLLDHSVIAPEFATTNGTKYQGSSIDMEGTLEFEGSGEVMKFGVGARDNFTLSTLMEAAKSNLDSFPEDEDVIMRYDGAVLLVMISYSNTYSTFAPASNLKYQIHVKRIKRTEYKAVYSYTVASTDSRTSRNMHGVKIVFVQHGTIGQFDFQTMLIQLVTALALLTLAQTIVDLIAVYLKDLRRLYYKAKFEETEDFSDIRDRLAAHPSERDTLLE